MTNREWLRTLSDEEFTKWCLHEEYGNFDFQKNTYIREQPSPRLETLKFTSTSSYNALLKWLKEERIEVKNE